VSGARLTVLPVRVRTQTGATPDSTAADFVTLATLAIERPATPPATAALRLRHPIDIAAGPFRLIGYECLNPGRDSDDEARLRPGDPLHIVLTWRPSRQPERDWRVAMRLVAADGAGPLSGEGAYPLAGTDYPTTHWQPGEVVRGQYDLFVPTDAAPGTYSLELGLSDETGRRDGVALTLCSACAWLESN